MRTVLIAEDEIITLDILKQEFSDAGYKVTVTDDGGMASKHCAQNDYDLVLLDMQLPNKTGLELIREIKAKHTEPVIVMITAYANIESAVKAIKCGADEYITKPYDINEVLKKIDELFTIKEKTINRHEGGSDKSKLLGETSLMLQTKAIINKVKDINTTVLITGESGTGKGVIAKEIHRMSYRTALPFVNVNCAAIHPNLIESELFGHEKGAFTSAVAAKKGRFELAENGTIFLDEIGLMPLNLQSKLLTVLQDRTYERVGGVKKLALEARIIAGTNENLEQSVQDGTFRMDLYYRLNVIRIEVPPLRYRRDDIIPLAKHFITRFEAMLGKKVLKIANDYWNTLVSYDWPGNVRELENTVEASVALCDYNVLTASSLPMRILMHNKQSFLPEVHVTGQYKQSIEQQEAIVIAEALKKFGGHREKTAKYLGISRRTLQYKLKNFGMLNTKS